MYPTGPISAEVPRGPSRRDFWYSAFLAALHRVGTDEAVDEADRALKACNDRWQNPHLVTGPTYRDDYSVGHSLPLTPETDDGQWPKQGFREHVGPWVRADQNGGGEPRNAGA